MSNTIPPLSALQSADPSVARGSVRSLADFAAASQVLPQAATPQAPPFANPSFQIDGPLGLLVMEFHDSTGKVQSSIPTTRQLEAYRVLGHVPTQTTTAAAGHVSAATGTAASRPAGNGTPETGAPKIVEPTIAVAAAAAPATASAPAGISVAAPSPAATVSIR